MELSRKQGLAAAVATGLSLWAMQANAGGFVGASAGDATIDTKENFDGFNLKFDESDTAYKIYGGWMFNDYLGVELGYVDLGAPSKNIDLSVGVAGAESLDAELTGWTLEGIGAIPIGPVDIFAKIGVISYDATLEFKDPSGVLGLPNNRLKASDNGEELTYGAGAMFNIGPVGIRAEYEMYDIGNVDNVYLWSVGAQFNF